MRKLALSDEILLSIEKPARYIGGEVNSVMKDPEKVKTRFAMCFPDVYEIGMSHLGIQILYDMINRWDDVWCERVYSPWVDLDKIMRERRIPLFALESQDPVRDFDFLGITIQYEMCYTNILQVLDLSGIPLLAAERTKEDPIVIGGGPCTYNPEPIADFFDLFYIGEGETIYRQLLDLYQDYQKEGWARREFLIRAAKIPGIYAPSLYEVSYHEDGTIASFAPSVEGIPEKIVKQIQMDLTDTYYPKKPVVPFMKITQDRVTLEIQRGCIRGCRLKFLKLQRLLPSGGAGHLPDGHLPGENGEHFPSFPAYRRFFSGHHGKGAGCEKKQPDLRAGGRKPAAAGRDQQGTDRGGHPEGSRHGL